jgi:hypothetical protein
VRSGEAGSATSIVDWQVDASLPVGAILQATGSTEKSDQSRGRHDSFSVYLDRGGLHGSDESNGLLASRSRYFKLGLDSVEERHRKSLADVARLLLGDSSVNFAFAQVNALLPGQELAVHTDVPHFRRCPHELPEWLRVVMQQSGLFEGYRLHRSNTIVCGPPVAGGDLLLWQDAGHSPLKVSKSEGSAVTFDADRIFHGVTRVGPAFESELGGAVMPCDELERVSRDAWVLRQAGRRSHATVAHHSIRFTLMMKFEVRTTTSSDCSARLSHAAIADHLLGERFDGSGSPSAWWAERLPELVGKFVNVPDWLPRPFGA